MIDKNKNQQPTDPNLTLEIRNDAAEAALKAYSEANTPENLNSLIICLRNTRVLIPMNLNDKKQPFPCVIKNDNGNIFMPVYTTKEQIPTEPKSAVIMNIPFLSVVEMTAKPEMNVEGIVINPFTNNMIFKMPLVHRIIEVEKSRAEGKAPEGQKPRELRLTEEQYVVFERIQFERGFLPTKFFENPQELINRLSDEKEEAVDVMFEESYKQKRMYPYLPEDFSVMLMSLSDSFTVARVDFPTRDMQPTCSVRAYLTFDKETDVAKYYLIETSKEEGMQLGEIDSTINHVAHGTAPVEGAELQLIIDMSK